MKNNPRNLEFRIIYDSKGMLISDKITAQKNEVWEESYIVVEEHFSKRSSHKVVDGKLVSVDTSIHVYHKPAHGILINNNPYFCKEEINDAS
jgi:hypothetical protein